MASPKPHIVVAMGSFHIPYHWRLFKSSLEGSGYHATIVNLPSTVVTGSTPTPDAMSKDIAAVREGVIEQIQDGHDVIALAHSAGAVAASAALEGLGKEGSKPGVIRLIYLAAMLIETGISQLDKVQGNEAPFLEVRDGLQIVHNAKAMFYNDLPDDMAEDAAKYICPNSRNIVETPISYVAWKYIPTTYIICERDNAITPAVAEWLISSCQVPCEVLRLDASHSPFLSMPDRLAAVIRRAAGEKDVDLEGVNFDNVDMKKEREAGWSAANRSRAEV